MTSFHRLQPIQAAFKTAGAAKYIGVSKNTIRKKTDLGLILCKRDENGNRIFLKNELDKYLESLPDFYDGGNSYSSQPVSTGRRKGGNK